MHDIPIPSTMSIEIILFKYVIAVHRAGSSLSRMANMNAIDLPAPGCVLSSDVSHILTAKNLWYPHGE